MLVAQLRQCQHAMAAAAVVRDQSEENAKSTSACMARLQRQLHEANSAESHLRENIAELTRKLHDECAERVKAEHSVDRLTAELRSAHTALGQAAESDTILRTALCRLQSDLLAHDWNIADLEQQRDAARADAHASSDELARLAAVETRIRTYTTAEAVGTAADLHELHERLAESQVGLKLAVPKHRHAQSRLGPFRIADDPGHGREWLHAQAAREQLRRCVSLLEQRSAELSAALTDRHAQLNRLRAQLAFSMHRNRARRRSFARRVGVRVGIRRISYSTL